MPVGIVLPPCDLQRHSLAKPSPSHTSLEQNSAPCEQVPILVICSPPPAQLKESTCQFKKRIPRGAEEQRLWGPERAGTTLRREEGIWKPPGPRQRRPKPWNGRRQRPTRGQRSGGSATKRINSKESERRQVTQIAMHLDTGPGKTWSQTTDEARGLWNPWSNVYPTTHLGQPRGQP